MYRLFYYISLIGFYHSLVDTKMLHYKYDPNMCTIHFNLGDSKTGDGKLLYDLSRKSGIYQFNSSGYVSDDDSFTSYPEISLNLFLCSYMRPESERLICGGKFLKSPSACVMHNSTDEFHAFQSINVTKSSSVVIITFYQEDKNGNDNLEIRILLKDSCEESDSLATNQSPTLFKIQWCSKWFGPAFEEKVDNSCQIQVDSRNETNLFDISPLTSTTINGDKYEYILNCTHVMISSPSGSSVVNDVLGKFSKSYYVNSKLVYSSHKGLFIRYISENEDSRFVQFNFNCISGQSIPSIRTRIGTPNIFDVFSTLSCKPKPFSCEKEFNLNLGYSFLTLTANMHNYEVSVSSKSKLIFNLCHPLLPTVGQPYTGGDILAVLDTKESIINLGVEQLPPKFDELGRLLVQFNGGDRCHEDPTRNYSFSVKLICNRMKSSLPELIMVKDCQYDVEWHSIAGCPYQHQKVINCLLEGVDIPKLNLTSLNSSANKFKTSIGELVLNPCGYINDSSQTSAVLRKNDGTELSIGKTVPTIEIRDGAIVLNIIGPPCEQGVFFSRINAEFVCKNDYHENSQPIVQVNSCIFNIKWPTNTVCLFENAPVSSCRIETETTMYDLAPLAGVKFSISEQNSSVDFILCSSLIGPAAVLCGPQSSACWISNQMRPNSYSSIGFYVPPKEYLSIEDSKVVANYLSAMLCEGDSHFSFKIIFECAPETADNKLKIIKSDDKCNLVVNMKTKHACAHSSDLITLKPKVTSPPDSCRRSLEPKIDLSHLKGKVWNSSNDKVIVAVCAPLPSDLSDRESGVCSLDKHDIHVEKCVNIGHASDVLLYKPRLPYLNYSGPGKEITLVTFPCNHFENQDITYRSLDDITHVVSWPTAASCLDSDEDELDETCTSDHLSKYLGKYQVNIRGSMQHILIGLCEKLPSGCLEGTAACLVDKTNSSIKYTPLGYPVKKNLRDNFGHIVLKFVDGAMCSRSGKQFTTILKLICEHSQEIIMTHDYESHDCIHIIEFKGLIGCTSDYSLETNTASHSPKWLFENLSESKPIQVLSRVNSHKYLVNFSLSGNNLGSCGVSVCRYDANNWKPLAKYRSIRYFEQNNTYKLEYESSSPSPSCNGYSGAEMFLQCSEDTSTVKSFNIHPNIKWENECHVSFEWVTDLACKPPHKNISTANISTQTTDYNWTMIILTILAILFPCIIVIVLRKKFCKFICQYFLPFQSRSRAHFSRVNDHSSFSSVCTNDENMVLFANPNIQDSLI